MAALTQSFVLILVDATVKATCVLLITAVIAVLLRHSSAAARHFAWVCSLGCCLCLPLLVPMLPRWTFVIWSHKVEAPPMLAPIRGTAAVLSRTLPIPPRHIPEPFPALPGTPLPMAGPVGQTPHFPWFVAAIILWTGGACLALARVLWGLTAFRQIKRRSLPVPEGLVPDVSAALMTVGVRQRVAVLVDVGSALVRVPLSCGVLRPVIVLPAPALTWPRERLSAALRHEASHIVRRDWVLQMTAQFVCAMYWFHPLVWLAARQMRAEAEQACDDLVLLSGMPPTDYARHLLDVVRTARDFRAAQSVVAMTRGPRIEARLQAVLAQGLARNAPHRRARVGAQCATLAFLFPLAMLHPLIQAQAEHETIGGDAVHLSIVTQRSFAPQIVTKFIPTQKSHKKETKQMTTYKRHVRTVALIGAGLVMAGASPGTAKSASSPVKDLSTSIGLRPGLLAGITHQASSDAINVVDNHVMRLRSVGIIVSNGDGTSPKTRQDYSVALARLIPLMQNASTGVTPNPDIEALHSDLQTRLTEHPAQINDLIALLREFTPEIQALHRDPLIPIQWVSLIAKSTPSSPAGTSTQITVSVVGGLTVDRFNEASNKIVPGVDHDSQLLAALVEDGAQRASGQVLCAADNQLVGKTVSLSFPWADNKATIANNVSLFPRLNRDGSVTIRLGVDGMVFLPGAMQPRTSGPPRTYTAVFGDGQTEKMASETVQTETGVVREWAVFVKVEKLPSGTYATKAAKEALKMSYKTSVGYF